MKSVRRIHAWLGVLFAPSILLFALSGIFQISGCHEGEGGSEPASWIVRLAQVHMKQTAQLPKKRAPRPAPSAEAGSNAPATDRAESPRPAGDSASRPTTGPLKVFFTVMSLSLIASTLLGLYIAFTSKRDRTLHVVLLAAGVVIPIVLLML
jgi:hypothetical protein